MPPLLQLQKLPGERGWRMGKKVSLSHFLADCRYIREAKVRRIKNQLYSPNTPNSVREQIFSQKERALGNRLTANTLMCLQMQMEIVADVLTVANSRWCACKLSLMCLQTIADVLANCHW